MQEQAGVGGNILSRMMEKIRSSAHVDVAFGQPKEIGGRTIIPVAVVLYGFGAGGGAGEREGKRQGEGGGGGGYVRVQPVAVLEVSEGRTRLLPVINWTQIARTAIMFLGLSLLVRAWKGSRRS